MVTSDLEALRQKVAAAVVRFKIELGKESGAWEFGTAFMVGPDLAVTVHHNQPEAILDGRRRTVEASFFDEATGRLHDLTFEWLPLPAVDCELHDVAALRLVNRPHDCPLNHLQPGLMPADVPYADTLAYWCGRRIAIYGFPIHLYMPGQADRWIVGLLHTGQPLGQITRFDDGSGRVLGSTEEFRCLAENAGDLEGISGAPIVDVETGLVVGVEHSYHPNRQPCRSRNDTETRVVCGAPLGLLQLIWPDFAGETKATWLLKDAKHGSESTFRRLAALNVSDGPTGHQADADPLAWDREKESRGGVLDICGDVLSIDRFYRGRRRRSP